MKKLFFITGLILSIFPSIFFAQTIDVDWGPFKEVPKDSRYYKIIGYDSEGFYVIRSKGLHKFDKNNVWLEYCSNTTVMIESSNEILMPTVDGVLTEFEALFYLNERLILLTSAVDKERKKQFAYIQYINEDGTLKNKPKQIGSLTLTDDEESGFNFALSYDKSQIIVYYHEAFNIYYSQAFTFKIFDANLKEVFAKNLELPMSGRKFHIVQYAFGKSGNIYMSAKVVRKKKKSRTKTAVEKYDNTIFVYNIKRDEINEYPIKLTKFIPSDITFELDNEENVIVFGFFTAKAAKAGEFSGIFYQKINPKTLKLVTNLATKYYYKVFKKEEMAEFSQKRNIAKESKSSEFLYDYNLNDIVFIDNGSCIFIAEHYYMETRTMIDPKTKEETIIYYYHYNDLYTALVDKDGNMKWLKRIPKNQNSFNDDGYFSSYSVTTVGSKVKIMYNDNPANLNINESLKIKELKNPKRSVAVMLTIYSDGSWDKAKIFGSDDVKTIFSPTIFTSIKDNFIIYGQSGKEYKFGGFFFE